MHLSFGLSSSAYHLVAFVRIVRCTQIPVCEPGCCPNSSPGSRSTCRLLTIKPLLDTVLTRLRATLCEEARLFFWHTHRVHSRISGKSSKNKKNRTSAALAEASTHTHTVRWWRAAAKKKRALLQNAHFKDSPLQNSKKFKVVQMLAI